MAQVAFDRVSKIYPDGTRAVNDITLEIEDGEFMVLVGPSGCGKTTALRMVAGLEEISEGTLTIGDRIVNYVPSRDRDIAMVFQSYALYPHLSVYENIAFGLRLKKMPKSEIDARVQRAASLLGLEDLLKRKPRALSGGQRQRVAMGRAIVREPAAFLMDEPLSNLDAKLRVQTRAEIAKLQSDLDVTTIYVTHDQIEAMTMGDRVAVMRKGELQQVADPQTLYDRPLNLFVGGFIGSPAMNLLDATIEASNGSLSAKIGTQTLALGAETLDARPALRSYVGKSVIIGIRPEDLEDAALETGAPADRILEGRLELREALGSEIMAHFAIKAAHAESDEMRELAEDVGAADTTPQIGVDEGEAVIVGRFGARSQVKARRASACRGRHARPPLLRPGIRQGHLRLPERRLMKRKWFGIAVIVAALAAGAAYASRGSASSSSTSSTNAVSGTVSFDGIWTGSEATAFGDVIKAFNKVYPKVHVNYHSLGNNLPTVLATAITGGHPPDMADIAQPGYVKQLVQQGHLKPISYAKLGDRVELRRVVAAARHLQREDVRASLQSEQQVAALVQRARLQGRRRHRAEDLGTADQGREHAQGLRHAGVLGRRRGRLDAHGSVREHLSPHVRRREIRRTRSAQDQVDRSVRQEGPHLHGSDRRQFGEPCRGSSGALQYNFNDSVTNAFASPPKAAIVLEGDFVAGVILSSTKAKANSGFNVAPFPSITPGADAGAVEISGDLFVTFRDNPAIEAFVKFLATAKAAEAWAKHGGFATGNHNLNPSALPNAIDRANQKAVGSAKAVVFDMSDEQPASFGATTGQGEWGIFQTFLRNPKNVSGIQSQLEKAATAAYKKGK